MKWGFWQCFHGDVQVREVSNSGEYAVWKSDDKDEERCCSGIDVEQIEDRRSWSHFHIGAWDDRRRPVTTSVWWYGHD